jgi:hypothetical protein
MSSAFWWSKTNWIFAAVCICPFFHKADIPVALSNVRFWG